MTPPPELPSRWRSLVVGLVAGQVVYWPATFAVPLSRDAALWLFTCVCLQISAGLLVSGWYRGRQLKRWHDAMEEWIIADLHERVIPMLTATMIAGRDPERRERAGLN